MKRIVDEPFTNWEDDLYADGSVGLPTQEHRL